MLRGCGGVVRVLRMDREGMMGGRRVSRGGTGEEGRMTGVGEQ